MIKVTEQNIPVIAEALKEVNGKAEEHTYTCGRTIVHIAEKAESRLSLLPKSEHKGAKVLSISGRRVASSYKYCRNATLVILVRGSKDWFVERLEKTIIWDKGRTSLSLTDWQQEVIKENYLKKVLDFAPGI